MRLLERVGELRDGFLVAGAAIYVIGYIVWSIHALDEGLGLLPALELQYFLAGSVVGAIIAVSYGLAAGVAYLRRSWVGFPPKEGRLFVFAWVWSLLVAGPAALAIYFDAPGAPIYLTMVGSVGLVTASRPLWRKRLHIPLDALLGAVTAVTTFLVAAPIYLTVVYPNLPQEIGGVKPRCGYLEVAAGDLSPILAQDLFSVSPAGTVRSHQLAVFFSGGDAYVVRERHAANARVVEIRKDIVRSVINC